MVSYSLTSFLGQQQIFSVMNMVMSEDTGKNQQQTNELLCEQWAHTPRKTSWDEEISSLDGSR